jgi:ferredoxin-type protein NapG
MPTPDDKPVDRRKFFRMGLAELLRPLASIAGPLERVAEQIGKLEESVKHHGRRIPLTVWLRPPGALEEQKFRDTCSRCGKCVQICPAQCIQIDPTGNNGNGAPYIDANAMACIVCEGLKCMDVCPSGALIPTSINDIDMGTAVWKEETCLRSSGQECRICVDHCPLGTTAIDLRKGEIAVNPLGCIGCGVCQHDCPTSPKSIYVIPIAAKAAGR